jgi:hypothetical protein
LSQVEYPRIPVTDFLEVAVPHRIVIVTEKQKTMDALVVKTLEEAVQIVFNEVDLLEGLALLWIWQDIASDDNGTRLLGFGSYQQPIVFLFVTMQVSRV